MLIQNYQGLLSAAATAAISATIAYAASARRTTASVARRRSCNSTPYRPNDPTESAVCHSFDAPGDSRHKGASYA